MSEDLQVLRPKGRLDGASSGRFESVALQVVDDGARLVLIDFEELDYVSSAGLRVILSVAKRVLAAGGRLAICAAKPEVGHLLEISGVDGIIDIHESVASATWRLLAG